jgi:hypothetical protein
VNIDNPLIEAARAIGTGFGDGRTPEPARDGAPVHTAGDAPAPAAAPAPASAPFPTSFPSPEARLGHLATALIKGTAGVRYRRNAAAAAASAAAPSPWRQHADDKFTVILPALRYLVRSLLPSLLRQAAGVRRSASKAGEGVVDAYGAALGSVAGPPSGGE